MKFFKEVLHMAGALSYTPELITKSVCLISKRGRIKRNCEKLYSAILWFNEFENKSSTDALNTVLNVFLSLNKQKFYLSYS